MTIHNAPAKINLMLQITHKEESGFHYLQSLITFYGKGDQIEVTESNAFSLKIKGAFGKELPIEGNLVLTSAEWLDKLYPGQSKASITLSKNLPLSSGIGGGSSDAAATIAALLDLWGIDLSYSQKIDLIKASGVLGADVPVCLAHQLLGRNFFWIDGTGKEGDPEALWQDDPKDFHLLLINPWVSVSTLSIFKAYDKVYDEPIISPTSFDQLIPFLKRTRNSLTPAACQLAPAISEVLKALEPTPGCLLARMSGSGATCFGIYETAEQAREACKIIKQSNPNWWVFAE
ncbi:MAG: 4-(cytidine 5'-diphospho)-2-C-methyl-D-erythritol kinase [Alphaproteobacteria bacterium]|nr:4-(cytidine 5'-diphospho)-2-C-methyl-D-erythritol kinase [Alphaproteobacteria bacterium]